MRNLRVALSLLSAIPTTWAHMSLLRPVPLQHVQNPYKKGPGVEIERYNFPIKSDGSDFPCKTFLSYLGSEHATPVATWAAGTNQTFDLVGGPHWGGSCQVSLSYDQGRSFRVIRSFEGGCPHRTNAEGQTFGFMVPPEAPASQNVIFSWSWNNREREFFHNCAIVNINSPVQAPADRSTILNDRPLMFRANIGNGCETPLTTHDLKLPDPGLDVVLGDNGMPLAYPSGACGRGAAAQGYGGNIVMRPGAPPVTPTNWNAPRVRWDPNRRWGTTPPSTSPPDSPPPAQPPKDPKTPPEKKPPHSKPEQPKKPLEKPPHEKPGYPGKKPVEKGPGGNGLSSLPYNELPVNNQGQAPNLDVLPTPPTNNEDKEKKKDGKSSTYTTKFSLPQESIYVNPNKKVHAADNGGKEPVIGYKKLERDYAEDPLNKSGIITKTKKIQDVKAEGLECGTQDGPDGLGRRDDCGKPAPTDNAAEGPVGEPWPAAPIPILTSPEDAERLCGEHREDPEEWTECLEAYKLLATPTPTPKPIDEAEERCKEHKDDPEEWADCLQHFNLLAPPKKDPEPVFTVTHTFTFTLCGQYWNTSTTASLISTANSTTAAIATTDTTRTTTVTTTATGYYTPAAPTGIAARSQGLAPGYRWRRF